MTQSAMNMHPGIPAQHHDQTEPPPTAANTAPEARSGRSRYASLKRTLSAYFDHHGHAVLYGVIGFAVAALILIIGFWPTVLLAAFAAAGAAIGKYRDGDQEVRA